MLTCTRLQSRHSVDPVDQRVWMVGAEVELANRHVVGSFHGCESSWGRMEYRERGEGINGGFDNNQIQSRVGTEARQRQRKPASKSRRRRRAT